MISKLIHIKPLENYKANVTFEDGVNGIIDISKFKSYFNHDRIFEKVQVKEWNPYWDEDFDMSADAMYIQLTGKNPFIRS